jgi:AraC-like DNA-binding protein/quercetin dioxygenase-like cupin family protein
MVWVKAGSASVVAGGAKLTCAASAGTGSRQIGDESDDAQHKPSRVDGTGGVAPNTTSAVLIPSGTKFSITTTPGALVFPIEFDDSIELKELRTVELVAEQADYLIYLFAQTVGYLPPRSEQSRRFFAELVKASQPITAPFAALPKMPISAELRQITQAVRAELQVNNPVNHYAAQAGVSVRTLQRRFLEETGQTFSQWRRAARLVEAKKLVDRGKPLEWTAHRVGYSETSTLVRAFKEQSGPSSTARGSDARADQTPSPTSPAATAGGHAEAHRIVANQKTGTQAAIESMDFSTWPRINAGHVTIWMYRGCATVEAGGHPIELRQGELFILPGGVHNRVLAQPGAIVLPVGYLRSNEVSIDPQRNRPITAAELSEEDLLHRFVSTYSRLAPTGHDPHHMIHRVIAQLKIADTQRESTHWLREQVLEIITQIARTPEDRKSLDEWAHTLGVPAELMRTSFREITGMTFQRWRSLQKMTIARELIARGQPISRVSRQLGYAHLPARAFVKVHGCPPQEIVSSSVARVTWPFVRDGARGSGVGQSDADAIPRLGSLPERSPRPRARRSQHHR